MTFVDIVILAVFALSAFTGSRKGLIKQIGSVAAIFFALLACRVFGSQVADMILSSAGKDTSSMSHYCSLILANAGIYIVVYYAVILAAKLIKTVTHTLLLGPLDRIAGAIVNVIKWFLALSVALNLYITLFPNTSLSELSHLDNGRPAKWIMEIAPAAWGSFTESINEQNG